MSVRTWLFIVAIGLTSIAHSGQAQEQAGGPGRDAAAEQQVPPALAFRIPVEIVESQAEAEARERSEKETREREIADLVAQQGMNTATQAMNRATQRMAEYAFWSTVFVVIGTVVLIGALCLSYIANRNSVDALRASVRPHLSFEFRHDTLTDEANVIIKNVGSGIALLHVIQVRCLYLHRSAASKIPLSHEWPKERSQIPIGKGEDVMVSVTVDRKSEREGGDFWIDGRARFSDTIGTEYATIFSLKGKNGNFKVLADQDRNRTVRLVGGKEKN